MIDVYRDSRVQRHADRLAANARTARRPSRPVGGVRADSGGRRLDPGRRSARHSPKRHRRRARRHDDLRSGVAPRGLESRVSHDVRFPRRSPSRRHHARSAGASQCRARPLRIRIRSTRSSRRGSTSCASLARALVSNACRSVACSRCDPSDFATGASSSPTPTRRRRRSPRKSSKPRTSSSSGACASAPKSSRVSTWSSPRPRPRPRTPTSPRPASSRRPVTTCCNRSTPHGSTRRRCANGCAPRLRRARRRGSPPTSTRRLKRWKTSSAPCSRSPRSMPVRRGSRSGPSISATCSASSGSISRRPRQSAG